MATELAAVISLVSAKLTLELQAQISTVFPLCCSDPHWSLLVALAVLAVLR